jgi:hypothetical protein
MLQLANPYHNNTRTCVVDLEGLITELHIRGFDDQRTDSALRCLVHVYAVQDCTNEEGGGVLVKDILNSYPLEVAQVASELYFERLAVCGQDVFRVKWGYEAAARSLEKQVWENASARWVEFVAGLNPRYLGFFLPQTYENARVVELWRTREDLKWFGVESEEYGRTILRLIEDVIAVGWAVDLVFGFRPFGPGRIEGQRTLIHRKAYESLKRRGEVPPYALTKGIRLWKFFSQFEPAESDVVKLMKECGVSLEEVKAQVQAFHETGLTTRYREAQYPPYLVADKMKKRYEAAVRGLLEAMERWLSTKELSPQAASLEASSAGQVVRA